MCFIGVTALLDEQVCVILFPLGSLNHHTQTGVSFLFGYTCVHRSVATCMEVIYMIMIKQHFPALMCGRDEQPCLRKNNDSNLSEQSRNHTWCKELTWDFDSHFSDSLSNNTIAILDWCMCFNETFLSNCVYTVCYRAKFGHTFDWSSIQVTLLSLCDVSKEETVPLHQCPFSHLDREQQSLWAKCLLWMWCC